MFLPLKVQRRFSFALAVEELGCRRKADEEKERIKIAHPNDELS